MLRASTGLALILGLAGVALANLPAVPAFDVPAPNADGSHTVRELRVARDRLIDKDVIVSGVITWAYDCKTAVRNQRESDRAVQARIDADPTLCERPKFYVGDDATTPPDRSLWVVDVPRVYNKMELERIAKADRTAPDRCEPGERHGVCPPYKVGDHVVVAGRFTMQSHHGETNSDGLLVFAAITNATAKWQTPNATWPAPIAIAPPRAPLVAHAAPAVQPPTPELVINVVARAQSADHMRAGARALAAKQYDVAVTELRAALAAWDGNDLAAYQLGGALGGSGKWADARAAFEHAVRLRPDNAMYQSWLGVALYEDAIGQAKAAQAKRQGGTPDRVNVDLAAIDFSAAYDALSRAAAIEPAMWRTQLYLGRIYRAAGDAKRAAEAFGAAVKANPREAAPYIALAEIYRRWDYADETIAVAEQAVANVPDDVSVAIELGEAYADRGLDTKAIAAFGNVLAVHPRDPQALFGRASAYDRLHDVANARHDFEEFVKLPGDDLLHQLARQRLAQ